MKDKVTIMVDHELREMIEQTKGVHGMTLGDVFETGIRVILMQMNENQIIDQELGRTALDISNLLQKEKHLKTLKENISKLRVPVLETKNNGNGTEELEASRNDRFSKNTSTKEKLDLLIKNFGNGSVNWERIIDVYKFKGKDEAREWFEKKLKEKNR